MEYEFNILYYVNTYKKWWKTIAKLMIIAMFFTALFSFLFVKPNYVSTVTVISGGSGGSSSSPLGTLLGLSGIGDSSSEIVIAILNSNRMAKDIQSFLELNKKKKFSYTIATHKISAGMAISVRGNDPLYTEKVANFIIQNLDKINGELNVTPSKPMVKVLDPASYGSKESRPMIRKVFVAGVAVFLLMSLCIFFSDYFKKLKAQQ